MCQNCSTSAVENIADAVNLGYGLEVSIRLFRDAVVQHFLMDKPSDDKDPAWVVRELRALSEIATDAGQSLIHTRDVKPEIYESLLAVRKALTRLGPEVTLIADEESS